MQILLFEYLTGGGLWLDGDHPPSTSWVAEGRAMLQAAAADFVAAGHAVTVLADARRETAIEFAQLIPVTSAAVLRDRLAELAPRIDWCLVDAPETSGRLLAARQLVESAGGRCLGSSPATITLAGDKHLLAEHLRAKGVPTTSGLRVPAGGAWPTGFPMPAVIKPCDGAGSMDVRLIRDRGELSRIEPPGIDTRIEVFQPGQAASIAFLCGPQGDVSLEPCAQNLRLASCGDDWPGIEQPFSYLGGSLPLPAPLAARARTLGQRAVATLPPRLGYLGVDLILGSANDGRDDVVVEVNPRLTTSYIGLRAACRQNLAQALLDVAAGSLPKLEFTRDTIEFTSSGGVKMLPAADVTTAHLPEQRL
ncbi:MAG: ATP-grasp domain-containing protein [Planctomycetes bacterium]|nr:ATP-grasp domain-containing protein [Planctomycetota bacterium]